MPKIQIQVSPQGAELQSIVANGKEYLWQGCKEYWGRRAPILFPIVGRVAYDTFRIDGKSYQMKQHGFARDSEFEFVSQTEDTIWFALKSNEDTFAKYPFHFVLHVGYQLIDNKVKVMWKVENPDDNTLYFSIGAHPAFNCPLKEEEKLFQQLDADGKELFERCDKLRSSLDSAGEEEVFILGFRLGVRLLLEALCED